MSETSQAGPPANPLAQFIPQRSAGLKLLLVCGLALLMAIPALFVFGVVQDRRMGADRALTEVSQAIGGSQSLLGPVLVLPFSRAPNPARPNDVVYGNAIAFAETGTADADVQVTERKRGIHTIPVFDAHVTFDATFDPGALRAALPEGAEPVWADARLYMGVSDTRGIREAFRVTANGKPVAME
ncbi:MAG: inner membrane CreD family protein, partial [Hyphomonas sp.]